MIFVEVEVLCDTLECDIRVKSMAHYGGPVRTPPGWTVIFMQRTEHHCPAHGAEAVDRYKRAVPVFAHDLKFEVGAP
jgi:hypothetical protein